MLPPRRPRGRFLTNWAPIPVGLILSATLVWQASSAAFSANTLNPPSNWATGTVVLTDDDASTAMFNAGNLKPGSTGSKCIQVSYNGNLGAFVNLYGAGKAATKALDAYIDVVVEQGTVGTFAGGCAGFTADAGINYSGTLRGFATTYTDFAAGFGSWSPTGAGQSRVYKITYTVNAAIPNSTQGATASIGLTWEAQSSAPGPAPVNHLDAATAGLESGMGHWVNWFSSAPTASQEQAHSGSSSMRIDVTALYGWGVTLNNAPGLPATPGNKTIRFWGRLGSATLFGGATLTVKWRNAAMADLQADTVTIPTLTTSWQQATADVVAPAGTVWVYLELTGGGVPGDYLYADDFFVGDR